MIDGRKVAEAGGIKEGHQSALAFPPSDCSQVGLGGPMTRQLIERRRLEDSLPFSLMRVWSLWFTPFLIILTLHLRRYTYETYRSSRENW